MADPFFTTSPSRSRSAGSIRPTRSRSRSTSPIGSSSASGWRTTSGSGVCLWHSFSWPGSDVFGSARSIARGSTGDRRDGGGPLAKLDAAFEFFAKLGVPFYCFHDRDVSPEGDRSPSSRSNLDALADEAGRPPGRDGRAPPVGHGQPLQPSPLCGRRRDQPGPRGLRLRRGAGQAHARGRPSASAARTTCCGAGARATKRCSTPTCRARRPSWPGSCTSSRSTSTGSGSRARC